MGRFLHAVIVLCGIAAAQDQLPAPRQFCVFNNPATTSCAFGKNVVGGNVGIIVGSNAAFPTPIDTLSTTYNLVTSDGAASGTFMWCGIFPSSGANAVNNIPANAEAIVVEMPAAVGCTVDASGHGAYSGTPGTITCPSITTTVNGDFIFSYVSSSTSSVDILPTSPQYALPINGGPGDPGATFSNSYRFSGVNGSYNSTFTNTGAVMGACLIAAFKPGFISIVTTSVPAAALSVPYKYCLQSVGGVGVLTWSIFIGSLPGGLSINGSTGCITGTPAGPGTTLSFKVTDGTHTATRSLTVPVNSAQATIGFVNSAAVNGSGVIPMGTVTSGNLLTVANTQMGVGASAGNSYVPPTDTLGTSFKLVMTFGYFHVWHANWLGVATATGSDTITLPGGSLANQNAVGAQFSGAQPFFDVAGEATGTNSGVATLTGPSLTTLTPNSELWLSVSGTNGSTWNAGSGYTIETYSSTSASMNAEHGNQASVGTYAPTFAQTANAGGQWIIEGLALRPAAFGPVSGQYRHKGWIF